jgi:hypothetical protein
VVIVGCGCRGAALGGALIARGHVVRGTTRRADWATVLALRGIEAVVADPDRVASLLPSLAGAGVLCVLLGSAPVAELHGSRLDMLLLRALDSTVRGVVYEASGTAGTLLADGAARVRRFCARSHIPFAVLERDPSADFGDWRDEAVAAVLGVLGA